MNADAIRRLLAELHLDEVVEESRRSYLEQALEDLSTRFEYLTLPDAAATSPHELALALERLSLDADTGDQFFDAAFLCRRSVDAAELSRRDRILHFFYLSVDAVLGERTAELRMLLHTIEPDHALALPEALSWRDELLLRTARAFTLLCRKGGGWTDVRAAAEEVRILRDLQQEREPRFMAQTQNDLGALAPIVAEYNLARIVDLAASFVIRGSPPDALVQIDRHASNAGTILDLRSDPELTHVADLLHSGARALVRGSVWHATQRLGTKVREFVNSLADEANRDPVLELWPSQRVALGSSLLDPAKRAIVVQMPTSAGKTLIAEFAAVQALALNTGSTVAYVVPTRALVNQITLRLRTAFRPLDFTVEAAVPVFELDPTEDMLLRQKMDVLVVTPEKLDLLIRSNHPAAGNLSLVVADEAHNIGNSDERSARFELLLGTIKRERPQARFLLLTPFVPNGRELADWLGDGDEAEGSIEVRWRPNERIAAAAQWRRRQGINELHLLTLPSAHNVDILAETEFDLGDAELDRPRSKGAIATSTALRLARRGGVLVLTRGRATAEDRAEEIASHRAEEATLTELAQSVIQYARSELGEDHALPSLLERGVAYHHAGLSHDLRYLIERLVDDEDVKIVCGTTTLAQGVNFPIATVIVETLQKPRGGQLGWEDLTHAEFWNIAGRAGRALRDRLGLVIFPAATARDLERARSFLQRDAADLASALLEAFQATSAAAEEYDLSFVRRHRTIAVFFQYLAHAMRVAGFEAASAQVEDLLRSSLVFHQVQTSDRRLAENLIRTARRFMETFSDKSPGYLALADGTGFSLPSVDYLYALQRDQFPDLSRRNFWNPDQLFSEDLSGLTQVVSILSDVPELTLGRFEEGSFDPRAVAGIVRDWVDGATVADIADDWFAGDEGDEDKRRRAASHYLYSKLVGQIPWGMGALLKLTIPDEVDRATVAHVPSSVFYGVRSKDAVALRMAGVPRVAAEGLAERWRGLSGEAHSFKGVRDWLESLPAQDWDSAVPADGALTGRQCRTVWTTLAGTA
jgi:helicase